MASSPAFVATPRSYFEIISSGITTRTISGVTGLTSLFAGGASGSRIDQIVVRATSTTTQGCIRLFMYSGSGNATLIDEISVAAITPTATDPAFNTSKTYNNLFVPNGYTLYVCTHNSESFAVHAIGGDF
jgi:hypothetical protein